jgi:pimeloyl-ACP methyl ester carboxylesterase
MHTTQFENQTIAYYTQKGEGIPLVFIHGFCEDSTVWQDFIARFPDRTILRIDLPGFGQSELIKDYSIARYAEVVKAVVEAAKVKDFVLIGHSMGGYVGLEFAKKYKGKIQGLCLFHSHPYADTDEKITGRKKSIEFIRQNGAIYYVKQLFPALFTKKYQSSNHLELAKLVFAASQYTAEGIIAGLECMISRENNTTVLEQVDIPYLFIIGKEDTVVPDYTEDIAKARIASIHVLPDVAHMGMLEAPKKCERIIKDFTELVEQFSAAHV